uniref:Hirustasin-like factor 1 n=1 Tax=Hirudo verbana TaxID=311461 RepID=A0A7T0KCC5_9ANNE|nr:hirustasin-like factor 1 [Hirudo verbana]
MKVVVLCCLLLTSASILSVQGESICGNYRCPGYKICVGYKCVCPQWRCRLLCPHGFLKDEGSCDNPCKCFNSWKPRPLPEFYWRK